MRAPFLCGTPIGITKLEIILELEQWTNRNQGFIQWTNRKNGGLQSLTLTAWKLAQMTAKERLIFEIQEPVEVLIKAYNYPFLSKYFNPISWPCPFKCGYLSDAGEVSHTPGCSGWGWCPPHRARHSAAQVRHGLSKLNSLWSFLFLVPQSPHFFMLKKKLEKKLSWCWAADNSAAQVRHGFSKRQMRKTAFVFVELSLLSSPDSAVINNF